MPVPDDVRQEDITRAREIGALLGEYVASSSERGSMSDLVQVVLSRRVEKYGLTTGLPSTEEEGALLSRIFEILRTPLNRPLVLAGSEEASSKEEGGSCVTDDDVRDRIWQVRSLLVNSAVEGRNIDVRTLATSLVEYLLPLYGVSSPTVAEEVFSRLNRSMLRGSASPPTVAAS